MHDIDIGLLRTFIILAETQSFTRTAKRVHRSQSAVSMQIARLEELLECSLFKRDKRNVRMTAEGEKLRGYASQIVRLSDNLVDQFNQPDVEGNINFGSPEDFATSYLPKILADFIQSHPRVTLNVNCDLTLTLINDFEKNKYDLIVIKQEPGNVHHDASPLWTEKLAWVGCDPAYRNMTFKKVMGKYLNDGRALPLVLSPAPCVYRQRALEALDGIGIQWKLAYTSPSFAGVTAAVKAGLGLTALPRNMVPGTLIPLENERGWPRLKDAEICLLVKPNLTPALKAFVSFIRDHISYNRMVIPPENNDV